MATSLTNLQHYKAEGNHFLLLNVTCDEMWVDHYRPETKDEIHGKEAFHIICKGEIYDNCEQREGDGNSCLGHSKDDSW
jgi:hypothetical protein